MIFGFNTDVKYNGLVYHVQSEARRNEFHLQTQVFVRGRCIGKKASSYREQFEQPGFSDEKMHEMLKAQHKGVVDAVREGHVMEVLQETYPNNTGFNLKWINAGSVVDNGSLVLRFQVTSSGAPVPGVTVISRVSSDSVEPIYSEAVTDDQGNAETRIAADEALLSAASVLVQAVHAGNTIIRKYRLRSLN